MTVPPLPGPLLPCGRRGRKGTLGKYLRVAQVFVVTLAIAAGATWGPRAVAAPPDAATDAQEEPTHYRGVGLCQFALEDYVLSSATEQSINQVVRRLLDQHRVMFKFEARPDFRLHLRIFGRFEDYARFTTNHGVNVPGLSTAGLTNLAGYYSRATRELVTWRQHIHSNFGNVLLHEASHAIMDAHFRGSPQWLLEGCAEYFAYPQDMQDAEDKRSLRIRWGLLNLWLRDGKLASLPTFVNLRQADWDKLDIDKAYIVSWSVFAFLCSSEPNRGVMRQLLNARGGPRGPDLDPAGRLNAQYQGGLNKLEADWHRWIVQTGGRLFPEKSMDALREADQERERRKAAPPP